MSGTSLDGVDAGLVDFTPSQPQVLGLASQPLDAQLRQQLRNLATPQAHSGEDPIELLGACEQAHAWACIQAIEQLLAQTQIPAQQIRACGVHGQTIRHRPNTRPHPFTIQIGNPALIAENTGIAIISDFRRRDIAAGGQGAPLVPPAHQALFPSTKPQIVLNLGGIANVSILNPAQPAMGFDTGPANVLMDQWIAHHHQKPFDQDGDWARSGEVHTPLLQSLLTDPFFRKAPPKSTGTETFNLTWLQTHLDQHPDIKPADVQATLLELTAQTVFDATTRLITYETERFIVCGGGAKNQALMQRLTEQLHAAHPQINVQTSDALGVDAQSIEAACFAWLARQAANRLPGNAPAVTGAVGERILGAYYPA